MLFGLTVFLEWLSTLFPTFLLMQGNTSVSQDERVERYSYQQKRMLLL